MKTSTLKLTAITVACHHQQAHKIDDEMEVIAFLIGLGKAAGWRHPGLLRQGCGCYTAYASPMVAVGVAANTLRALAAAGQPPLEISSIHEGTLCDEIAADGRPTGKTKTIGEVLTARLN